MFPFDHIPHYNTMNSREILARLSVSRAKGIMLQAFALHVLIVPEHTPSIHEIP
jgi:hypothetical protein